MELRHGLCGSSFSMPRGLAVLSFRFAAGSTGACGRRSGTVPPRGAGFERRSGAVPPRAAGCVRRSDAVLPAFSGASEAEVERFRIMQHFSDTRLRDPLNCGLSQTESPFCQRNIRLSVVSLTNWRSEAGLVIRLSENIQITLRFSDACQRSSPNICFSQTAIFV